MKGNEGRKIMSVLHLVVKRKWFDQIVSGRKKIEYREYTPYWCKRLLMLSPAGKLIYKYFDEVSFRAGYGKSVPGAIFSLRKITIKETVHPDTGKFTFNFLIHIGGRV